MRQSYHGEPLEDAALDSEEVQLHYRQQNPKYQTVCSETTEANVSVFIVTFPGEKRLEANEGPLVGDSCCTSLCIYELR